jgi:hypothetical protein
VRIVVVLSVVAIATRAHKLYRDNTNLFIVINIYVAKQSYLPLHINRQLMTSFTINAHFRRANGRARPSPSSRADDVFLTRIPRAIKACNYRLCSCPNIIILWYCYILLLLSCTYSVRFNGGAIHQSLRCKS